MRLIFLLPILFLFVGCDLQKSTASTSSYDSKDFVIKEDFESYPTGTFTMVDPLESINGALGYISHEIVSDGCAQGEKCLKTKSIHLNFDPYYCAFFVMKNIIPDLNNTFYGQFYFKYSYPDTFFSMDQVTSGYFEIAVYQSIGLQITALGNVVTVVDPGSFSTNTWYRVETKIESPDMPVLNIRVYEANKTTPMSGSTLVNDIAVYKTDSHENHIYSSRVYTKSEDLLAKQALFTNPETDLEPYAWFVDDIRIGYDENETLTVGF